MSLAKACGLDVAKVKVVDLGERVLQVERFDRALGRGKPQKVLRTHMIDGCQALDIAPDYKYERFLGGEKSVEDIKGPATLKNIYQFCENCRMPAQDRLRLLQWVIFCWIIGNSDNHMKNLSFFVTDNGISLAPFYDLASVTCYEDIDDSLAFNIGGTFDPKQVSRDVFYKMGEELGLSTAMLKRQIKKLRDSVTKNLEAIDLEDLQLNRSEKVFIKTLKDKISNRLLARL